MEQLKLPYDLLHAGFLPSCTVLHRCNYFTILEITGTQNGKCLTCSPARGYLPFDWEAAYEGYQQLT